MWLTSPGFIKERKVQAYDRHQIPEASDLCLNLLNMELLLDVFSHDLTIEQVHNTMCVVSIVR